MSAAHEQLVLGLDGGNTKTIALLARLDGTILGVGRAGCGDIYGARSEQAALAEIDAAVAAALQMAGAAPQAIATAVFSLAGADWPEDFSFLHEAMAARGYGRIIVIVNDAIGALRAGSTDGTGVSVVCGTGLAVGARGVDRRVWHGSFWLESSGSSGLAHAALKAVYRAELGILPPTAMSQRVLEIFGCHSVEEVLHRQTARHHPRLSSHGAVARALLDEAAAGDRVALDIVCEHGRLIGDYALVAAQRVDLEHRTFPLVLAGGVLRHSSRLLVTEIVERVQARVRGAMPVESRFEPAIGALLLALDEAGVAGDESVLHRLAASAPPGTLFDTSGY